MLAAFLLNTLSQEHLLVKPLLFPGITRHINKFLRKAIQKRVGGHQLMWSQLRMVGTYQEGHYILIIFAASVAAVPV